MGSLRRLSDSLLKESYNKAVKLKLNPNFIKILKKEKEKRKLLKGDFNYQKNISD